jgi:hypothetical protein
MSPRLTNRQRVTWLIPPNAKQVSSELYASRSIESWPVVVLSVVFMTLPYVFLFLLMPYITKTTSL